MNLQIRRRALVVAAAACMISAPMTVQAQQTFVDGSISLTSLFGPNPAIPLGWFTASQTASGNLSIPVQARNVNQNRQTIINSGVLVSFAHVTTVTAIGPGQLVNNHQPGGAGNPKPATFSPTTALAIPSLPTTGWIPFCCTSAPKRPMRSPCMRVTTTLVIL
ncbi:MAG: hypothetical protein GY910_13380 [bacterium]|nr:hypothetical protein [bacterium]